MLHLEVAKSYPCVLSLTQQFLQKLLYPTLKLSFQSHFLEKICKFFAVLVYSLYFNAKFILNLYLPKCFFRRRIFSLILFLSIAHKYSLVLTVLLRNVLGHLHHATPRLSLPLPLSRALCSLSLSLLLSLSLTSSWSRNCFFFNTYLLPCTSFLFYLSQSLFVICSLSLSYSLSPFRLSHVPL